MIGESKVETDRAEYVHIETESGFSTKTGFDKWITPYMFENTMFTRLDTRYTNVTDGRTDRQTDRPTDIDGIEAR